MRTINLILNSKHHETLAAVQMQMSEYSAEYIALIRYVLVVPVNPPWGLSSREKKD